MRARVLHQDRMPLRLARMAGVVLAAMLLVAQVMTVSAQKGGIGASPTSPEGTPGPMQELDPSALEGLGGLLEPREEGGNERAPGQIVNNEYGYTIDYQSPWESYGTWDRNGFEQEYLFDPATDAWLSVTAWEWTGGFTVQDTIAWWASPENIADWMPDAQVLKVRTGDTTGAVVFFHPATAEYPNPWLYVSELHVHDGYAVEITFSSTVPDFNDAYPATGTSVTVNAVPAVGIFTMDEILATLPAS